jgi:hypothetical protein
MPPFGFEKILHPESTSGCVPGGLSQVAILVGSHLSRMVHEFFRVVVVSDNPARTSCSTWAEKGNVEDFSRLVADSAAGPQSWCPSLLESA